MNRCTKWVKPTMKMREAGRVPGTLAFALRRIARRPGWIELGPLLCAAFLIANVEASCVDYGEFPHWKGGLKMANEGARGVEISGDLAFVANGRAGFSVIDIGDPSSPLLVANLATAQSALDLAISGAHVFVLQSGSVTVVDVSNPRIPSVAGSVEWPNPLGDSGYDSIVVSGHYAYVNDRGLRILDISNAVSPRIVISDPGIDPGLIVAVEGNFLFAKYVGCEFSVFDVSDVIHPKRIGEYTDYSCGGINIERTTCIVGNFAYTGGTGGFDQYGYPTGVLEVVDITSPSQPALVTTIELAEYPSLVDASKERLCAVTRNGVSIFDLADPAQPRFLGELKSTWTEAGQPTSIGVAGGNAYIYHAQNFEFGTLSVLDISGSARMEPVGEIPRTFGAPCWSDGLLYTLLWEGPRFVVVDVSDVGNIKELGSMEGMDEFSSDPPIIEVSDGYAYVASPAGLAIIDVSEPTHPLAVGRLDGNFTCIAVENGLLYAASGAQGLVIVDVRRPENPAIVSVKDTPGYANGIVVVEGLALVGDGWEGLSIFDVHRPDRPELIGRLRTRGYVYSLAYSTGFVWVADGETGVTAIDISNPENPAIVGGLDTAEFVPEISVFGQHAYLWDAATGLSVLDISNPEHPRVLGGVSYAGSNYEDGARMAAIGGGHLYLSAWWYGGTIVYPAPCETSVSVLLNRFEVQRVDATNDIRWSVAEGDRYAEFRLVGERGSSHWNVDFREASPGDYVASDQVEGEAAIVYSLFSKGAASDWSLLAQRRFEALPGVQTVRLLPASPNPFNPSTRIQFDLAVPSGVKLSVFDMAGRHVRTLIAGDRLAAGRYAIPWKGLDERGRLVASGVYVCKLECDNTARTQRLTLLK